MSKRFSFTLGISGLLMSFTLAYSQAVLIPYVKSGGNWVSLITYYAKEPFYESTVGKIHIAHVHKPDWSNFSKVVGGGSYAVAECSVSQFSFRTAPHDTSTFDISGSNKLDLPGNVLANDYETSNSKPTSITSPSGVSTDGYVVVRDGRDTGESTLTVEAVVFDMVTGMFFYQYGINLKPKNKGIPTNDFAEVGYGGVQAYMPFQGEEFATTSIYYIPGTADNIMWFATAEGQRTGYIGVKEIYDRKGERVRNTKKIAEVKCLGLIPLRVFLSDEEWNTVGQRGGTAYVSDSLGSDVYNHYGILYKGEVYKIGKKPNIFSPLKVYELSSVKYQQWKPAFELPDWGDIIGDLPFPWSK